MLLTSSSPSLNALAGEPEITPFLEFVRFLGMFLVPAWLWIGQSLAFLKIARREPVTLEDLFRGGPWLLTVLLATGVLLAVAAIPCLLIYGAAEGLLALGGGDRAGLDRPEPPPRERPVPPGEIESELAGPAGVIAGRLRPVVCGVLRRHGPARPVPVPHHRPGRGRPGIAPDVDGD